jgi:hypothetical protein
MMSSDGDAPFWGVETPSNRTCAVWRTMLPYAFAVGSL